LELFDMPRKKKEETGEETNDTTTAQETDVTEAAASEGNADENQNNIKASAETSGSAEQTSDEPSILDSVIDTVTAVAGSVATAVTEGVSSVVEAVAGSSDGTEEKGKTKTNRAEKIGVVASDKMTKTVTVRVDRVVKHPVYRKYIKRRKKFMAHDETGATIGDKVRIVETRPLSARKRWRVVEIIQKAEK
jgi:small subunit ribosomal protein S17